MMIMRKYILLLCTLCAGLVSCVKEDFPGVEDGLVTFKASYETQTKTVLNGLTPYWTPSEKITIFNGVNNEFTANVTEPSSTATFKGELAGKGTKNFRAVTPYSADYTFSSLGSTFYGLSVPQEQTAVENTYDPQALVAIAVSDDYNLSFKNLGSLVKFTVISDGVTSVTLRSNNEELLSGTFEATYAATPSMRVREGKDEVTIKGDFKKGSTYYIVTLPATLEKGFIALLNGSVKAMSIDAPVQLTRSGMVNLGELSLNPGESQLPDSGDEDEDEGVPSGWVIIGSFCDWSEEGTVDTYDLGLYYKAFDVPAANLASFKFRNGDVWLGLGGAAAVADEWVTLSEDGAASDIAFSGTAEAYDVYLDMGLRGFYVTAAGGPAPEPIPAPFTGKSVAGNFNAWSNSANPMTSEGEYYVVKGLQLAATNVADPSSDGFKFVDVRGTDDSTWYGVGSPSIEPGKWYTTKIDGSVNIKINGDAAALYDAYISKDMTTFCVVAAGAELPSQDEVGGGSGNVETVGTLYVKPNANWKEADARFAAYFFEGDANTWMDMTDADGDGVYECGVPSGYSNVIFTRMNPATSDNNWDNKWNQTDDLKVPTDGTDFYTVKEGTWDNGGGTWSTYGAGNVDPKPEPEPETPVDPTPDPTPGTGEEEGGDDQITACRLIVKVNEGINWYDKYVYSWVNDQPIIGNWPGVKMEWVKLEGGYHYYYYDFNKSYNGKVINYIINNGNGGNGNQTIDLSVTLNGAETTVVIESSQVK